MNIETVILSSNYIEDILVSIIGFINRFVNISEYKNSISISIYCPKLATNIYNDYIVILVTNNYIKSYIKNQLPIYNSDIDYHGLISIFNIYNDHVEYFGESLKVNNYCIYKINSSEIDNYLSSLK